MISQSQQLRENSIDICFNLTVSEDLLESTHNLCHDFPDISYNKHKFIEEIIPIVQVSSIHNSFVQSNSDYILFLDGDTVFLRPFVSELLIALDESESDIAMAHECGSTGIKPYANYNCGFLLMKKNNTTELLIRSWLKLVKHNRELAKHGNQRLFPHALGMAKPRVFSIDNVYNLRCHPVYGNIAQVLSPVYMVHNQHLSHYWTNEINPLKTNLIELINRPSVKELINRLDQSFTPSNEPYKPRYVGGTFINLNG